MKKNREISVSFGRTVNTGNFNSIKISVGTSRELSAGEDIDEAVEDELEFVRETVAGAIEDELKKL